MARKLIEDLKFKVDYKDKAKPKGNDTIIILVKKTKKIVEVSEEGIVNVTDEVENV